MERRLNRARMEINALAEDIDKRIMLQPPRDMPTGSLVDDARCCINKDKDTCLHDIETSLAILKSRVDVALQASNPDGNSSTEAPSMLWASIQEVPVIMAQPFLDGFKEATVVKVEDEVVCTARSQEFEQLTSWVRRELSQVHEKLDVKFQKLHSLLEGLKTSRQGPAAAEVAAPATEPFASASAPSLSGSPGKALRNSRPKQDHPSVRHMLEEFRTSQLCMVEEQQTTKSMIEDFRQLLLSQVEELAKEQKSCRSMLEELRVSQRGFAEDQIVSVVREEFEQLCRTNSTSLEEFQQQQQSFRHDLQELAKEQKSFRRTMEDLRVSQLGFTEDLPKPRSIKIVREECERGWRNIRTSQEVSRSKLDEPPPCDVAGLPLPKPSIAEEQRVNREIKRAHLKETQSLNLEAARFGLGETAVQQAASTPVSPVSARCSVSFGEVNRTRLPSQKQKQTSVQQEEASQLKVRLIMSPRTEEPEKALEKQA